MAITKDQKAAFLAEIEKIQNQYAGPAIFHDGPIHAQVLQLEGMQQLLGLLARILLAL